MSRATMRFRPGISLGLVTLLAAAFAATQLAFAAPPGEPAATEGYAVAPIVDVAPDGVPARGAAAAPAHTPAAPDAPPATAQPPAGARDASAASARAALRSAAVASAARPRRPLDPRRYRIVRIRRAVGLSERPGGPVAKTVGPTTEFGSPRFLSVAARRGDWLGVVTSERPNGRLAWIPRDAGWLRPRATRWSLHADISARTLTLRRDGRRVHRLSVAVGTVGSPTPTGRFAVTDKLSGARFGPYYGCCILALNGHQPNPPPGWTGGNRLAIHGTDAPETIGAAASAGCLRAADADLQVLMRKVPLGTPVFVRP